MNRTTPSENQNPSHRTSPLPSNSAATPYQDRVICVTEHHTVSDVLHLMKTHHIGDVVVVEERQGKSIPIGIVTDRDLALLSENGALPRSVSECFTEPVVVARADEDVFSWISTMKEHGVGRLPLVDSEGVIAGIVTAKHLMQKLTLALADLTFISTDGVRQEAAGNSAETRH